MGLIVTTTVGVSLWIILWSIGAKSFDAFLLTVLLVLIALGIRLLLPYLPGNASRR
jgi:hypothetical protein